MYMYIYYTAGMLKTNGPRTKVLCRLLPWNDNFEVSIHVYLHRQ